MTAAAGLVDTLMAGRAGVDDLAGVSLGSAIWLTLGVGVMGLFMAVNPIVAQYIGAGQQRRIPGFMHQTLRVSVILTLLLLLRLYVWYLPAIIDDADVVRVTGGYLDGFSWGLPAFIGTLLLRPYSDGLALITAGFNTTLLASLNQTIAGFYTQDTAVAALAARLLLFAALFQLADALVVPTQGALRGYKDTSVPLLLAVLAYWIITLPLGYILGLSGWLTTPMGAEGFWIALVVGLSLSGLLMTARLWRVGRRRSFQTTNTLPGGKGVS